MYFARLFVNKYGFPFLMNTSGELSLGSEYENA